MTENFYKQYFESIAKSLRDIGHNPDSGEERFFFIRDVTDPGPVLNALRNTLALPALLVEQFDDSTGSINDNFQQQLFGAFYVLDKATPSDYLAIDQAKERCRDIARKIHAKMLLDSRSGTLAGHNIVLLGEMQGRSIDAIGGIGYGWGYSFRWATPLNLRYDPADWSE